MVIKTSDADSTVVAIDQAEMGFHHVGQAGLELLTSSDLESNGNWPSDTAPHTIRSNVMIPITNLFCMEKLMIFSNMMD